MQLSPKCVVYAHTRIHPRLLLVFHCQINKPKRMAKIVYFMRLKCESLVGICLLYAGAWDPRNFPSAYKNDSA